MTRIKWDVVLVWLALGIWVVAFWFYGFWKLAGN